METMMGGSDLTEIEVEGLKEMKILNQDFLNSGKGGKQVREFLLNANDSKLLIFLRCRKNRPKHAWETLKRNAEVRFEIYPELYPDSLPNAVLTFSNAEGFGVLKNRDKNGSFVTIFDTSKWDPDKTSLVDLIIFGCRLVDRLLEKGTQEGFLIIIECSQTSVKHAKQYTLSNILKLRDAFWNANPIRISGAVLANLPPALTLVYKMASPFIPKKLKGRFLVSSTSNKFTLVHELVSPDILPKCLGGNLEYAEAIDMDFFKCLQNDLINVLSKLTRYSRYNHKSSLF